MIFKDSAHQPSADITNIMQPWYVEQIERFRLLFLSEFNLFEACWINFAHLSDKCCHNINIMQAIWCLACVVWQLISTIQLLIYCQPAKVTIALINLKIFHNNAIQSIKSSTMISNSNESTCTTAHRSLAFPHITPIQICFPGSR